MVSTAKIRSTLCNPKHIQILLVIVGVLGMIIATRLSNPYTKSYPLILIAVGILTAFTDTDNTLSVPRKTFSTSGFLIIYHLLAALLLITFAGPQTRTPTVLLLTLALYIWTIIGICYIDHKWSLYAVLITAILHRATIMFAGPELLGNDAIFHNRMAEMIAMEGDRLPLARAKSHYFSVPVYHVFVASLRLFYVPTRVSAFFAITVPYAIIPGILIYSIGRKFYTKQLGVVGSFLFVASDYALGWSVLPSTTSLGLILFSIGIYSVIRVRHEQSRRHSLILLVILLLFPITHQVSTFVYLSTLGLFACGLWIYSGGEMTTVFSRTMVGGFIAAGIWLFVDLDGPSGADIDFLSWSISTVISRLAFASLFNHQSVKIPAELVVGGADSLSFIHVAGGASLALVGIAGFLQYIYTEEHNKKKRELIYALGVSIGGLFAVTFAGPIVGFRFLQPMRFFQFIYVILCIIAPIGIISIIKSISLNGRAIRFSLVALLVVYTMVMGGTFIGAVDDPIFDNAHGAERYEMTETEHALYKWSAQEGDFTNDNTVGDHLATVTVSRLYDGDANTLIYDYDNETIRNPGSLRVIVRPELFTNHAKYRVWYRGIQTSIHHPLPQETINCHGSNRIYNVADNHSVIQIPSRCSG